MNERMLWHQHGATPWARNNGLFELIHTEEFFVKSAALKREKYFKTGQGRITLDIILARGRDSGPATKRGGALRNDFVVFRAISSVG